MSITAIGRMTHAAPRRVLLVGVLAGALVEGCGSASSSGTQPVTTTPAIAAALSATSASVPQGNQSQFTVTVTGSGGYAGSVSVAVQGAPAGVTATVSGPSTSGSVTTATVTLAVASTATAGTYQITVVASGSGVANATASFSLTVTATTPASFALSLGSTSISVAGGASGVAQITIARTNFTGPITLSLQNPPTGVTGTFTPNPATATAATLTLTVASTASPGNYTITILGTGTGASNQSAALALTVTAAAGGTGNATVDFSACAALAPTWFAFQDGTGPWTRVLPTTPGVFSFTISQATSGYAYVTSSGTTTSLAVRYQLKSELSTTTLQCPPKPTRTVAGVTANVGSNDLASISYGGGVISVISSQQNFQITGALSGMHDLFAYRADYLSGLLGGTPNPDKVIIRQDQDFAPNASIATLDFNSSEAVNPASATFTINGLTATESVISGMTYVTGATCDAVTLYSRLGTTAPSANTYTARGIPPALQRSTDYHLAITSLTEPGPAGQPSSSFRTVVESFHTLGNRTVPIGSQLPVPTINNLGGPYKRLEAVFVIPADYNGAASLTYLETPVNHTVSVVATPGWLGGASARIGMPDLSAAAGWSNSMAPASSATGTWGVAAGGSNVVVVNGCPGRFEGGVTRSASRSGTF